jgi:hypothetical protein
MLSGEHLAMLGLRDVWRVSRQRPGKKGHHHHPTQPQFRRFVCNLAGLGRLDASCSGGRRWLQRLKVLFWRLGLGLIQY